MRERGRESVREGGNEGGGVSEGVRGRERRSELLLRKGWAVLGWLVGCLVGRAAGRLLVAADHHSSTFQLRHVLLLRVHSSLSPLQQLQTFQSKDGDDDDDDDLQLSAVELALRRQQQAAAAAGDGGTTSAALTQQPSTDAAAVAAASHGHLHMPFFEQVDIGEFFSCNCCART